MGEVAGLSDEKGQARCGLCGEFCDPFCGAWANVEPTIPDKNSRAGSAIRSVLRRATPPGQTTPPAPEPDPRQASGGEGE
jgi:hypothetical protein